MYRLLLALFLLTTTSLSARNLDSLMQAYGLVEVTSLAPRIRVELKYATRDNFIGANMYGSLRKAYLHPNLAHALARAQQLSSVRSPAMPSSSMMPHALRAYSAVCIRPWLARRRRSTSLPPSVVDATTMA